jgi:DNA-binding NtrC family response regulator
VRDKYHVLIVKAEQSVAELWEQALERAGYLVSCADRAGGALRRLESERIDALIIDGTLSDMTGQTLAQAVRQRWPDIGVLLLQRAGLAGAAHLEGDPQLQLLPVAVTTRTLRKRLDELLHDAAALQDGVRWSAVQRMQLARAANGAG